MPCLRSCAIFFIFALSLTLAASRRVTSVEIEVGAFNIQVLGTKKMDDSRVVDLLVDILLRYDVVLIQEIRDSSETAIFELLDAVNEKSSRTYAVVVSERLGRSSSKEQYAYMYKTAELEVIDTYEYNDIHDKFERPPYVAGFKAKNGFVFNLIGIHTSPEHAAEEIDALHDVYTNSLTRKLGVRETLILGDFNADCKYVSARRFDEITLHTSSRYTWFIDSDQDTTVSDTDCAYDRIVATDGFEDYVVPNSDKVFDFRYEYGIWQSTAAKVSDHYPVELVLRLPPGSSWPWKRDEEALDEAEEDDSDVAPLRAPDRPVPRVQEDALSFSWSVVPYAIDYEIRWKVGDGKFTKAEAVLNALTYKLRMAHDAKESIQFQVRAVGKDSNKSKWSTAGVYPDVQGDLDVVSETEADRELAEEQAAIASQNDDTSDQSGSSGSSSSSSRTKKTSKSKKSSSSDSSSSGSNASSFFSSTFVLTSVGVVVGLAVLISAAMLFRSRRRNRALGKKDPTVVFHADTRQNPLIDDSLA